MELMEIKQDNEIFRSYQLSLAKRIEKTLRNRGYSTLVKPYGDVGYKVVFKKGKRIYICIGFKYENGEVYLDIYRDLDNGVKASIMIRAE